MIESSNAFKKLKLQIQDSMDILLLCCHAIPALKAYGKAVKGGQALKLPDPDYFGTPSSIDRLEKITPKYRKTLGKLVFLNSFSYFEAYISEIPNEFLEFHGMGKEFSKREDEIKKTILDNKFEPFTKKLREPIKKGKEAKYKKIKAQLINNGYYFPKELISTYGMKRIQKQLEELKAVQIPDLLKDIFELKLSETEIKEFTRLRDFRNDIAHGKVQEVDLRKAISSNEFFRNLAIKIDKHIVTYFFVTDIS